MKLSVATVAVLGVVSPLVILPSASAQTLGTHEPVTMIFVGGEQLCVAVDKMRARIYRAKEPKRVRWQVTVPGHYWEIRYQPSSPDQPSKPEGMGDYFANSGDLDIGCSGTSVATEIPVVLAPANAQWPYMIKVYECNDGVKGAFICELDPIIDWGDG
jgi:hypothetical protein